MKTLIIIHGGMSFATKNEYLHWLKADYINWIKDEWKPSGKKWKSDIGEKLLSRGGKVFMPQMPCDLNAKYEDWIITFKGLLNFIDHDAQLDIIGHSLGGCFLLKYFSEEHPKLNIKEIHLIAACISEGDFTAPTNYDFLRKFCEKVHIWHAEDDDIVPFSVGKEISEKLPEAVTHFFPTEKGYGHFHTLEKIPELEKILISK